MNCVAANLRRTGGFEGMPWLAEIAREWASQARAELPPDDVEHQEVLGAAMTPKAALNFALEQLDSIAEIVPELTG